MPSAAGQMIQKVQFLRRDADSYQPLGDWQWAAYSFERAVQVANGGMRFAGKGGRLTVRNCDLAIGLLTSDRVRMNDEEFRITIVKQPLQRDEDLNIEIESALTPALYENEFDSRGETVILRRNVPDADPIDKPVRAVVTGYQPEELEGGIVQGDRRVMLYAPDVAASSFPVPIKIGSTDRVIIRGRTVAIQGVDDSTHRIAGNLLAYDVQVRGA